MAEGYSLQSCFPLMNVSEEQAQIWREQHPEFDEAIQQGEFLRQKYWEEKLINAVNNPNRDSKDSLIIKTLQSQFDWNPTSKVSHSHSGNLNITVKFKTPEKEE